MYSEFLKELKKHNHIGVFSHIRPDGDCIGSQVAMCRWLEANGYTAYAFNDDPVPQNLQWLCQYYPIHVPGEEDLAMCDLFILLDGNAAHRFGSFEEWQKKHRPRTVMIDHHPDPNDGFDIAISVDTASSTSELVYDLFAVDNIDLIDEGTAKALYTGLITDTGSLQYDSVTPKTMEVAADLLRRGGFTPNEVAEQVFSNKTVPQLRLLSKAMSTIQLFENNQIAVMYVTQEMLDQTGTTNADCEGFVSYPLSIQGIKAALFAKDLSDEGIKMSLRSRSHIDVNIWARELGGGGHKKAAGAWHKGPLDIAIQEAVKIGAKQLNKIETDSVK
ncbi:MAG: bifunctional oligoribonuclease/PAP phosphatase NrnA [Balneolaceae bacterium]